MENNEQERIRLDKEGNWYYGDAPIIHPKISNLFSSSIESSKDGGFILNIDGETCEIDVEDTPFMVTDIDLSETSGQKQFIIQLNDLTREILNLDSIMIGKDNVLYCKVKGGTYDARFLRKSYHFLTRYVEEDIEHNEYYIAMNDKRYYLK